MLKTTLATIGGLVIGLVIIMAVESLGHLMFPPPEGVDLKNPEELKSIMDSVPFGAKLAVLLAWGLGIFGGGTAGVLFSGRKALPATIIAVFLLVGSAATLIMIPHPMWMIGGTLVVTAAGWFGATRFAKNRNSSA